MPDQRSGTAQLPRRDELVQRVHEATEKAQTLAESQKKAWHELQQAKAQYEFLVTAERHAWDAVENARHDVKMDIERETWEVTS